MNEKNFKENLKTDNVAVDKANILPNLGADKQRLEVEKIAKIIADVTDGNFDKLETDEDVYNALQRLSGQDVRLIFKACVDAFLGIKFNTDLLNKLNKSRIIALFFDVFGIYPEKNPSTDSNTNSTPIDDAIIEEYLPDVFPNFNGAVELDFSKVANLLPPQLHAVQSVDELKKSLTQEISPEGQDVRIFVEGAIKAAGLNCNFTELNAIRREYYLPLFFYAVNFTFPKKTLIN